jgi:hypothetical protein
MLGNTTVLACWDAHRLDIGRMGVRVRTDWLATEAARVLARHAT